MHWSGILLYAVVLLWLVPAMAVHRTAIVLFVAWVAGEIYSLHTGDHLPIPLYLMTDAIAFGLIMSWRATLADTLVLGIYPAMWLAYLMSGVLEPRPLWWLLYALTMAQFFIAGPWPAFTRNRTAEFRRVGQRALGLARTNQ